MANQYPEQEAREKIDEMLTRAGWVVLSKDEFSWSAGPEIALREYPTANVFCFANGRTI